METAITALFPNGYTVAVTLPNIAMTSDEREQTVSAYCTKNVVKNGAGCAID